jgi:hypothetical protein
MLEGERSFGRQDGIGDVILPLARHAGEVRLIADFVIEIVVVAQLCHDLLYHCILNRNQPAP